MIRSITTVFGISLALASALAVAQGFPSRPVRIIVSHSAGGPPDVATRALAAALSQSMGQPFVVENRDGANGIVGTEAVAKSAPDGYTLLVTSSSTMTLNPFIYANLPFDVENDFAPVVHMGTLNAAIIVHPSVPARSMQELMQLAKAKPDSISFATVGASSAAALYAEWMRKGMGAPFYAVPYKNYPQALTAVTAGDVQVTLFSSGGVVPLVKAGKVRPLATAADERSSYFPDLPSLKEAGFDTFFRTWFGLYAPAGTPQAVVQRLNAEAAKALASPVVREKYLAPQGFEMQPPAGAPAAEFAKFIRDDREMYRRAVKVIGLKPQ